jgi:diguanylate cyclase (GGDEF)-like protein/PAS domain S-box-containing protein
MSSPDRTPVASGGLPALASRTWFAGRRAGLGRPPRHGVAPLREQQLERLLEFATDTVAVLDAQFRIVYVTPTVSRFYGWTAEQLVNGETLLGVTDVDRFHAALIRATHADGGAVTMDIRLIHRNGTPLDSELTITSRLGDGVIDGIVVTARDVTERRVLEGRLTKQAYTDSLTGLGNRLLFGREVDYALDHCETPASVAVLFLDLNGFKAVNDSQGHATGDVLLAQVAQRLRGAVRPDDVVARLGGDEFAILLTAETAGRAASWVAQRVHHSLTEDFLLDGRSLAVGTSIGIAVNETGDESADQLLRNADLAMYRAKADPSLPFVLFEPPMHEALVDRVRIEDDLRLALARGEMLLHYQPIVTLRTGQVIGAEALMRWQHPDRGLVPPVEFIPIAESTGLIEQLGEWALDEACRAAATWQPYADPGECFRMSVNVSARQLGAQLPRLVRNTLARTGLPAAALTLEMTESVVMERSDSMVALLGRLKQLGVRLALDDFGTGYSSLAYLARFPVDVLKIDRAFVDQIVADTDGGEVARTILKLAEGLRLTAVAEGVETPAQAAALDRLGCASAQGYWFGRPMPAADFDALLRSSGGILPLELSKAS